MAEANASAAAGDEADDGDLIPWRARADDEGGATPGGAHPVDVCESRAMASTPMPRLRHALSVRMLACAENGTLSQLQLETVRAAMDALRSKRVFALGDGTGVGKARTLAGVIQEWRELHPGCGVVWLSANMRLHQQSAAELRQVAEPTQGEDGEEEGEGPGGRVGCHFTSYAALRHDGALSAAQAAIRAAGTAPLIVCDECHLLRRQRTMYARVEELMATRRDACLVYSSATMMSLPEHLLYLSHRFGLCGASADAPFDSPVTLRQRLRCGGAGILELTSMHLRSKGLYVSRQLSMRGVSVDTLASPLSVAQKRVYDRVVHLLKERECSATVAQRVCFRLLTGFKLQHAFRAADAALERGEKVVFVVTYTGEACLARSLAAAAAGGGACPTRAWPRSSAVDSLDRVAGDEDARGQGGEEEDEEEVEEEQGEGGDAVPGARVGFGAGGVLDVDEERVVGLDAADQIVLRYGADDVAEITGRTRRLVPTRGMDAAWDVQRVNRLEEVAAFQGGAKRVALLSRAGGIGLSLHDNGTGRRTTIVLELPWSPEDLTQLMGRTHRAASVSSPSYILCVSDVPAEMRIAYSLSRRVRSMGALTRGDRGACDTLALNAQRFGATSTAHERRTFAMQSLVGAVCALDDDDVPKEEEEEAEAARATRPWTVSELVRRHCPELRAAAEQHDGASRRNVATVADRMLTALHSGSPQGAAAVAAGEEADDDDDDEAWMEDNDDALLGPTSQPLSFVGARPLPPRVLVAAKATACYPDALMASVVRWSPETHHLFGPRERALVRHVLMSHSSSDARRTLGLLPDVLLHMILERALDHGADAQLLGLIHSPNALRASKTHEAYLNSLLYLPIRAQEGATRMMRHAAVRPLSWHESSDADLLKYTRQQEGGEEDGDDGRAHCPHVASVAEARAGSGVSARVARVDVLADSIVAHVECSPRVAADEVEGASCTYWRHVRSASLVRASPFPNGTCLDGKSVLVERDWYAQVPHSEWATELARRRRHLARKISRLPVRFHVLTRDALFQWDQSFKRIVRVEDGDGGEAVGLLVRIQ